MTVFLKPKFEGERFAGLMPLETLAELSTYRDLVVDVAKVVFYERHPGRKRVPKGFADTLRLGVRKVEGGSAVPVIERLPPDPEAGKTPYLVGLDDSEGFDDFDYFAEARDRINALVAKPSTEAASAFPERTIRHFNKFGATLGPGESVTLAVPGGTSPKYDQKIRKRIVLLRESTYEDRFEEAGMIVVIDRDHMVFQLRLADGRRVPGNVSEDAFHDYKRLLTLTGFPVRMSGVGLRDGSDNLVRVTTVEEIVPEQSADEVDALDIKARLEVLAQLDEGWLDEGRGSPIPRQLIELVTRILEEMVENFGTLRPHLYPTPGGGLHAEWTLPDSEVSIEFSRDGKTADFYALMTQTQTDREEQVSTHIAEQAAASLADLLAPFVPASSTSS